MKKFFQSAAAALLQRGIDALSDPPSVPVARADLDRIFMRDHKDYRSYLSFCTPMERVLRFNIMNRPSQTVLLPRGGWEPYEGMVCEHTPQSYPELVIHATYTDYRNQMRTGIMIRPGYDHDALQGSRNPDAALAAFGLSGVWKDEGIFHVEKIILPVFNGFRQIDGHRVEDVTPDMVHAGLIYAAMTVAQMTRDQTPLYYSNFLDAGLRRDRKTMALSLGAPAP